MLRVGQQFVVILHHPLDAKFIRHSLGNFQADIANRDQVGFRDQAGNISDMDAAHASGSDDSDIYFFGPCILLL